MKLNLIFLFILSFLYAIVGLIIGLPYTICANGGPIHFFFTAMISPAVLIAMLLLWGNADMAHNKKILFLLITGSSLPIVLNALSALANLAGLDNISDTLFALRYWTLLIPALLAAWGLLFLIKPTRIKNSLISKPPFSSFH